MPMISGNPRERLRSVRVLAALTDEALDALGARLAWIEVAAGQEVVSHLESSAHVYFTISGAFRVYLFNTAGRLVTYRALKPGSHFGEIAALTGSPRTVSVAAETSGLIARCAADVFRDLMRANPDVAEAVAIGLARNVVILTDRVFELAALEARYRIYGELLRLARRGEATPAGIVIRNAPTHEMIAAAAGAQREVVTRELRHLAKEGMVRQDRRELIIVDLDRLSALVERVGGMTASQVMDWGE